MRLRGRCEALHGVKATTADAPMVAWGLVDVVSYGILHSLAPLELNRKIKKK